MSLTTKALENTGELFIMGFSGLELGADTAAFIRESKIGGVILFSPNYESPAQVAELTTQVQECRSGLPLWVSVDHEGGKVQRFKKSFTRIPEAADIAATGSPNLAFEISSLMARELSAVGVNLNFCPVADINTNPKNPVIGSRSFGDNEEQVSKFVTAMVRGHLTNGVQACVKHFPGHGDTAVDSHFALPKVTTPIDTLRDREWRPFSKAFKSRCAMVMTAHILFPEIDPDYPATLSPKILRKFLREELRYNRVIVSDDMEMAAITDHYGAEDAPRLALQAGCDLLIYRSEKTARAAHAALQKALAQGTLAPEVVLAAVERSRALKREVLANYRPPVIADLPTMVGIPEHQAIVDQVKPRA
jgi:beta-N-acetylhexosaminidase